MDFTKEDIIKAMECCIEDNCDDCPCSFGNCYTNLIREALYIINTELEQFANVGKMYSEVRAEAIKEFAERLKKAKASSTLDSRICTTEMIDSLVKEMTEGNTND